MAEILEVFNQPGAGFVHLLDGVKYPPIEREWQKKPHTFAEAAAHEGNVGVLAGNGYIGLDKDDPAAFEGLELPPTTLWETRPGRLGLWLRNSDNVAESLATIGKKADQAQLKLFKDGKAVGEVKLERTYQVIPPSWKNLEDGTRADYKMLESIPPATISLAKLLADLQAIGITFEKKQKASRLEANGAKLESIGKKANQKRIESDEARTRRYAVAALRDEVLILASTPEGNRNEQLNRSAFAMGQFVAAKVLSEDEVISELTRAAENTGLELGEIERTIRSGLESGARHPREISAIPPRGKMTMTAPEILERINADPKALKEPVILAVMAALKANDPIEYDLFIASIKKTHKGIKVDTIHDLIDKHILESKKATEKPQETPKIIKEKARAIATRGDSLKFLIWQAQRNHLGDIDYQKVLIASIASAASQTSNGIQPGGNGDKGSGKSDACAATYHLVPMDRRLDGSLSPMSLFYLQTTGRLQPGMILFSDDVEYEPIIPIYKRATARFQQGITHFTVTGGKTREAIELKIPPRMVWWLTSVESVANEQAFDRQYPISTDSSPDHKQRVSREIAARRARKELRLAEDEGIEVAREIITDIFDNGPFKVLVPQSAKSEWLKVADFRGQEQFWDLVDALVILRWRQHKQDVDGWLIAADQDLIEAKGILTGHKVAHFADLTEAEAKLIGVMSSGRSMTQKELTEALEIAQATVSARLTSIMAKSAIITENYELGRKTYAINPKMDIGTDFWAGLDLIDLKIDNTETYRSQKIALSYCYRYFIGLPIGIIINNSRMIPSSLSVNVVGSMERDTCSCEKCLGWEENIPSSILISPKHYDNQGNQQQESLSDTDKSDLCIPISTYNASVGSPDIPIRQTSDTSEEIRVAAISEYGLSGWVDPRKIANALKLQLGEVEVWLQANYAPFERPGGGIGYKQRRAGEAPA